MTIDVHTFPSLGSSLDAVCFLILISDFMSLSRISLTKVKMIHSLSHIKGRRGKAGVVHFKPLGD
jgi:hypothetical protein